MAAAATPPIGADSSDAKLPGGGQEGNRRVLKAFILEPTAKAKATGDAIGQTKELPPDDLLNSLTADGRLLMPPFDKLVLAMLPENSSSLYPVMQAMAQNCDGFGHHLECRIKLDQLDEKNPDDKKMLDLVLNERADITNFLKNCNPEYSFSELRKRTRIDIEGTGEAFWEVIRVPTTNAILGLNHIPSYQILLGAQDWDLSTFSRKVPNLQADGSVELQTVMSRKRWRRFCQARISTIYSRGTTYHRGAEVRWFKEFGDDRPIDNRTGEVIPKDQLDNVPEAFRAGELIHFKLYSPRTPYGLPRYIGNLITLFGDRAADEINYNTLKNNNVPSMMLMVSNGQFTQSSIDRMQEFVNAQIAGQNNYSKFLILEAEGNYEGEQGGVAKIGVEKMTSEQMKDQLFQNYSKNNSDKIRQVWRIPPVFVGQTSDYTRSTAEAARRLADEQVFSPEREEFDNFLNQNLLPQLGVKFHSFVSNGPNVTDDEDLINVMTAAEKSGGMTPRMARSMIADILGMDEHNLPPLDPSIKPDIPFTLQVAEAVKNTADPNHQLAVKSVTGDDNSSTLHALMKLRDQLELTLMWRNKHGQDSE